MKSEFVRLLKLKSENIKQQKVSDILIQRLGDLIIGGHYSPGQKLPPERELAQQFGTSRSSLRSALDALELQGYINRVQGGGNYVSEKVEKAVVDPLLDLLIDKEEFKYDLLEYRHALEEACCYLAAERATEEDKENIQAAYNNWVSSFENKLSAKEEAEADLAFHLAIAEASHNLVLPHAMRNSLSLVKHSVTTNLEHLEDGGHQRMLDQHKEMLDAILAGDPERARSAVRYHLEFVKDELEKNDIRRMREQRFQRNSNL